MAYFQALSGGVERRDLLEGAQHNSHMVNIVAQQLQTMVGGLRQQLLEREDLRNVLKIGSSMQLYISIVPGHYIVNQSEEGSEDDDGGR